jgi:hypothetical protein
MRRGVIALDKQHDITLEYICNWDNINEYASKGYEIVYEDTRETVPPEMFEELLKPIPIVVTTSCKIY